ncbi:hypothetical protein LK996_08595 [Lysobacter sp. A6]|uniref:Uncharacterized protein n=1 Tax=Noviluteimonas lactosilytica TaxID=2888523 RepID=A0ABS8JHP9_9GAMM|nr:hypothetical protein [Lysobacter lactosilyticus]MCC8363132.1 hypothetical protein [Lysobacter lactosilyticus]
MPNQESVNLNVKFGPQPGQGWTEVIAANGQVYAFKYSGGANNNGGLETQVGQGTATINVSLSTDNRYSISDVVFTGDGNNQLTRSIGSTSAATITDINTVAETADYCVVVADSVGNTTILCDPMIKNDPKTPMAMMAQPRIVHS